MLMMLTLFSVASLVSAGKEPCPIALDIITVPDYAAIGLTVSLKQDGFPVATVSVNQYKEAVFELSGVLGVECTCFEATILECDDNPICHKTVCFNPQGYTQWDISSVELPCPEPVICPECEICPDLPPSCEEQGYILPEDCEEPEPCPDCPFAGLFEIVISVIISLTVGGGIGITIGRYKNTGKLFLKITRHKHPEHQTAGARKLHSIYTIHNIEPHPKGEQYPKYDERGKYVG